MPHKFGMYFSYFFSFFLSLVRIASGVVKRLESNMRDFLWEKK